MSGSKLRWATGWKSEVKKKSLRPSTAKDASRHAVHARDVRVLREAVSGLQTGTQDLRYSLPVRGRESTVRSTSTPAVMDTLTAAAGDLPNFLKEPWLKPISGNSPENLPHTPRRAMGQSTLRPQLGVHRIHPLESGAGRPPRWRALVRVPSHRTAVRNRVLEWWNLRQYVEDYASGNVGLCGLSVERSIFSITPSAAPELD